MAKKKPSSRAKAEPEPAPEPPPEEPAPPAGPTWRERAIGAVFRPRRLLVLGLVPLTAVLVPFVYRMLPDLSQRDAWRLTAEDLTFTPAPADPVPADLAGRVVGRLSRPAADGRAERGPSLLDRDFAETLAGAVAAEPWVAGVVRVETAVPASATVTVTYRVPAAAVRVRGGLYPVDAAGVLLPPGDFTRAAAESLPVIEEVPTPPGPAGTPWPDEAVTGAAAVAAALADEWDALGLAAVVPVHPADWGTDRVPAVFAADRDAARPAGVRFALRTRGGSRIYWGRPPGGEHPTEVTTAQKIGRLTDAAVRQVLTADADAPVAVTLAAWGSIYYVRL